MNSTFECKYTPFSIPRTCLYQQAKAIKQLYIYIYVVAFNELLRGGLEVNRLGITVLI